MSRLDVNITDPEGRKFSPKRLLAQAVLNLITYYFFFILIGTVLWNWCGIHNVFNLGTASLSQLFWVAALYWFARIEWKIGLKEDR